MARKLEDILNALPKDRAQRLIEGGKHRLDEYKTLQDLRRARELTQEHVAETLGVRQENISRLEKRSDLLLSTLRGYIRAMGGDLDLVATFPDRDPVVLSSLFSESSPEERTTA